MASSSVACNRERVAKEAGRDGLRAPCAGPAAVVSSVTFSLQAVSTTYVCPLTPSGTTTLYSLGTGAAGTKIGPVMLMKAPKSAPPGLPLRSVRT